MLLIKKLGYKYTQSHTSYVKNNYTNIRTLRASRVAQ